MKIDVQSRMAAFAASLALAVLATLGVAVSMSSITDGARTGLAADGPAGTGAAADAGYAGAPVVTLEKTVVIGSMQTLSAWKAPVATASQHVM